MSILPKNTNENNALQLTIVKNNAGLLTKEFSIDGLGNIQKKTHGLIWNGTARVIAVSDLDDLENVIRNLTQCEALILGTPRGLEISESIQICSEKNRKAGAITRSKANFSFLPTPSVMVLDCDEPLKPDEFLSRLLKAIPQLDGVGILVLQSASSGVSRIDSDTSAIGGCHAYILVDKGSDIPKIGKWLHNQLWLSGEGFISVSKSGVALDRTLLDRAVYSPERVIFEAMPVLHEGLTKTERQIVQLPGNLLKLTDLPEHSEEDIGRIEAKKAEDTESKVKEIDAAKRTWSNEHQKTLEARGFTRQQAKSILNSPGKGLKPGNKLTFYIDGEARTVDVIDVLLDPAYFDCEICDCPVTGKKEKGMFYQNTGLIFSFASGGVNTRLDKAYLNYSIRDQSKSFKAIESLLNLAQNPAIFMRGCDVVTVTDKGISQVKSVNVPTILSKVANFYKVLRGGDLSQTNLNDLTCRGFLSNTDSTLPKLNTLINAPIVYKGDVIRTKGYNWDSGLFLKQSHNVYVPSNLDRDAALKAFERIREYWSGFPFKREKNFSFGSVEFDLDGKTCLSEAVCLALLITMVQRPLLGTAPMFGVSANNAGVGKSQLVEGLGIIATGQRVEMTSHKSDEAEDAKCLLTYLKEAKPIVCFDNQALGKTFVSDALCSLLTSERYSDRILGSSATGSYRSDCTTFVATGNNLVIGNDLCRRTLMIRLECLLETPESRVFDKSFTQVCTENRDAILSDLMTILIAFEKSDFKSTLVLGSFDRWADSVGKCVEWLTGYDVTKSKPLPKNEGDVEVLSTLMHDWEERGISDFVTAREAVTTLPIDVLDQACRGKVSARNFSDFLKRFEKRVINNRCFELRVRHNTQQFKLCNVQG